MLLIIDYDNVHLRERNIGLDHVVRKALSHCQAFEQSENRVRARIYGGWCEAGRLTRKAQLLSSEIQRITPINFPRQGSNVLIDVQLALSTLSHPQVVISNSFRQRGCADGLICEARPWLHCKSNDHCSIDRLGSFFDDDVCGDGCPIRPGDILRRAEQKVVDTMMVADLILYSTESENKSAAVVTRDDDIWPGLAIASTALEKLIHISTSSSERLPGYYGKLEGSSFKTVFWS